MFLESVACRYDNIFPYVCGLIKNTQKKYILYTTPHKQRQCLDWPSAFFWVILQVWFKMRGQAHWFVSSQSWQRIVWRLSNCFENITAKSPKSSFKTTFIPDMRCSPQIWNQSKPLYYISNIHISPTMIFPTALLLLPLLPLLFAPLQRSKWSEITQQLSRAPPDVLGQ